MSELVGPLTAEEWCSLRLRFDDGDLLHCCGVTSDIRDLVFSLLRMGDDRHTTRLLMEELWDLVNSHDWDQTSDTYRLLERMRGFYLDEKEVA